MAFNIIGAGMAGLLAGRMLARHKPVIVEKQAALPNNHSAVLRFRTSVVADALGIPFKAVNMIKATLPWRNPVADALQYSFKNTGEYRSDRSVTQGLVAEKRYIAPEDLVWQMAQGQDIKYNTGWSGNADTLSPTISTIPMPVLMTLLSYPERPSFSYQPTFNVHATVDACDAYVSLLVVDPEREFTRISLMGNKLIIEVPHQEWRHGPGKPSTVTCGLWVMQAGELLGIDEGRAHDVSVHASKYGKIKPIDEDVRRDFIHWASHKHNVWSLGRFATWRPGVLLDDLVKDIRLIEGWIGRGGRYGAARHWQ